MATVGELASLVQGQIIGQANLPIDDLAELGSAGPRHISFFANRKYMEVFRTTGAGAVLVSEAVEPAPCTLIVCANPYLAMARVAVALHPPRRHAAGVAPGAHVARGAEIDASATVCTGAVVEAGAMVGPRAVLMAGVYVGPGARVGADCLLHPGVKVMDRCLVGERVILHPGVVIGADGFGFAVDPATGKRHKIPQVGIVELGDDVEIGANTTVDRATFGVTRVGAGCKIDNLVQIGHNVQLGRDCVVVSQSGIAGSTALGDRVIVGAQVGMVGHLSIASDVTLGARTGVTGSIDTAGVYSGMPAIPHKQWLKAATSAAVLPDLRRRVRALEARVGQPSSSGSSTS